MRAQVSGSLVASGKRLAIVASRWNDFFCDAMVKGAVEELERHGADPSQIAVYRCPGCFELPLVAARLAARGDYDGIICLGVLIRGATPHFDFIASAATSGIARVSLDHGVPVGYGVITCESQEQAIERSGSKAGNKGGEAALATVELVNLLARIDAGES